MKYHTENRRVS